MRFSFSFYSYRNSRPLAPRACALLICRPFGRTRRFAPLCGREFESHLSDQQEEDTRKCVLFLLASRLRRELIKIYERGIPSPLVLSPCKLVTLCIKIIAAVKKGRTFVRPFLSGIAPAARMDQIHREGTPIPSQAHLMQTWGFCLLRF